MSAADDARDAPGRLEIGTWLTLAVALVSGCSYWFTRSACSGDGSFDALGSGSRRSAYCRALNLPAAPTSLGTVCLTLALFALPTVLWIGFTVAAQRRRKGVASFQFVTGACGALVAASLAMIAFRPRHLRRRLSLASRGHSGAACVAHAGAIAARSASVTRPSRCGRGDLQVAHERFIGIPIATRHS